MENENAVDDPNPKNTKVLHKCPKCDRTFANIGHMKCHFYRVHPEFKLSEFEIPEVSAPENKPRPPIKGNTPKLDNVVSVKKETHFTYKAIKPSKSNSPSVAPVECVLPDLPEPPVEPISLSEIQLKLFKCEECSKCFSNNASLQKHCVSIHSVFQCNICKGTFPNASRLKGHMEVHSTKASRLKNRKAILENTKLKCKLCNRVFVKKTTLHAHMQHDHGALPDATLIKCAECREVFTSPKDLKTHAAVHRKPQEEKSGEHTCDLCDKTFARKCNLDKHVPLHKVD